ncbi:MAG: hypothetical protein IDH49_03345 [Gammaproteobacteria bacterium]|nr:hypothetical protein [Gammaproteobacteria bacterium]
MKNNDEVSMAGWVHKKFTQWLAQEAQVRGRVQCDFDRLRDTIRPADVLLVEGHTRLSQFIKNITQSQWTHSALYVGHLHEIADDHVRRRIQHAYRGDPREPLLIEGLIGEGIIAVPLRKYRDATLRLCQPRGLSGEDATKIVSFAAHHLGIGYDTRQLFDLARLVSPYGVLPRRWRSTLFDGTAGIADRTICSTLIAAAFQSVNFPVLPVMNRNGDGEMRLYQRNPRLCLPRDFDYSPYFDSIKFPPLALDDVGVYRDLPWDGSGVVCNGEDDCPPATLPESAKPEEGAARHEARGRSRGRRTGKHRVILGASKT